MTESFKPDILREAEAGETGEKRLKVGHAHGRSNGEHVNVGELQVAHEFDVLAKLVRDKPSIIGEVFLEERLYGFVVRVVGPFRRRRQLAMNAFRCT